MNSNNRESFKNNDFKDVTKQSLNNFSKLYRLSRKQISIRIHKMNKINGKTISIKSSSKPLLEYINQNCMSVQNGLIKALNQGKYILVGEEHLPQLDNVRKNITQSLSELKKSGLTHLCMEIRSDCQNVIDSLDWDSANIKEEFTQNIGHENFVDIVITAKRIGLKVICIDKPKKYLQSQEEFHMEYGYIDDEQVRARHLNERDEWMFNIIKSISDDAGKILIFVGGAHVSKYCVEIVKNIPIITVGTSLTEHFGTDKVISIQYVSVREINILRKPIKNLTIPMMLTCNELIINKSETAASEYVILGP